MVRPGSPVVVRNPIAILGSATGLLLFGWIVVDRSSRSEPRQWFYDGDPIGTAVLAAALLVSLALVMCVRARLVMDGERIVYTSIIGSTTIRAEDVDEFVYESENYFGPLGARLRTSERLVFFWLGSPILFVSSVGFQSAQRSVDLLNRGLLQDGK